VLQEYEAALESEDYATAARLVEEGHLGLTGWWKVADSNAKNPDHLLCVVPAFGRLVFKMYNPQDLGQLYVRPPQPPLPLPKASSG